MLDLKFARFELESSLMANMDRLSKIEKESAFLTTAVQSLCARALFSRVFLRFLWNFTLSLKFSRSFQDNCFSAHMQSVLL